MASRARPPRFAVIGAGMAGILSAIKLQERGLTDFTVYEKADRVGGTWRENTYPGVACDVPAHLYSYSFAPNPEWSHTFAPGSEIQAYFERAVADHGVDRFIRFGDEVTCLERRDGRWHLETASGHHDVVDVVIAATGVLHHPNVPEFDGLDTFDGSWFHSARWVHEVDVDTSRVGVVGTGSSAIQITSALASRARSFTLFQRTAQWVLSVENRPYADHELARYRNDPAAITELREFLSRSFSENFADAVIDADSPQVKLIEEACRANLDDSVSDPELRERLRPDYRAACKRLVISPTFYDAIQHPKARLVTAPIEHVEPAGVRTADGEVHELDVLVLATGFRVDRFLRPIDVVGDRGVRLDDVWSDRPTAYLSVSAPDFPNLFMLNGPNGPVGNFSLIEVAELQFDYVMQLVDRIIDGSCTEIVATREATDAFEADRIEAAQKTVWVTGCRSWYLDDRGIPAAWPWTFDEFRARMASPDPAAFDCR